MPAIAGGGRTGLEDGVVVGVAIEAVAVGVLEEDSEEVEDGVGELVEVAPSEGVGCPG